MEERQQTVVVLLRNRIDLVIMAPGAVDGQTKEHLPGRGDHVIQDVELRQQPIGRLVIPQTEPVIPRGDDRVVRDLRQFVTSQLLTHKLIIRLVVVEGSNHVVAITPRVRLIAVAFKAVGVGTAHDIEPMPSPAFSIAGRLKQSVNHGFKGLWRSILDECCNFRCSGR